MCISIARTFLYNLPPLNFLKICTQTDRPCAHYLCASSYRPHEVYEDDLCVALKDANPVAPTHVLIVPKHREGLTQLRFATPDHEAILGHLLW